MRSREGKLEKFSLLWKMNFPEAKVKPFATTSHKIFQWLMLSQAQSITGHYKSIFAYNYERLSFSKTWILITDHAHYNAFVSNRTVLAQHCKSKETRSLIDWHKWSPLPIIGEFAFRVGGSINGITQFRQWPLLSHTKRSIYSMNLFVCRSCFFFLRSLLKSV